MFGLIALFAAAATTNVLPLTQNPQWINLNIIHHIEKVVFLANFTLNTFHPLSIFHDQYDIEGFTLKEAMRKEDKIELVISMVK